MSARLDDLDVFKTDALEFGSHHLGSFADIVFVLFGGAHAGNAQQIFQFLEEALLIFAGIIDRRGNGWG